MSKYSELEEITVVGIDLAKSVFHLHGVNKQGHAVVRKKLSRNKLAEFMPQPFARRCSGRRCVLYRSKV